MKQSIRSNWWVTRLPIYNLAILLALMTKSLEAYFFPDYGPPEAKLLNVIISLISVIVMLNVAYVIGPIVDTILFRNNSHLTSLRWSMFTLGTALAVAFGIGASVLILTPF